VIRAGLVLALALLAAAPARAATVQIAAGAPPTLEITAAPGERNDIRATIRAGGAVVINDFGAPLRPGAGCTVEDSGAAVCPDAGALPAVVILEDGDDRYEASIGGSAIDPGPGDDRVVTGFLQPDRVLSSAGDDEVRVTSGDVVEAGGAPDGADRIDLGGGGTVTYEQRSTPVRVLLNAVAASGADGERDTVTVPSTLDARLVGGRASDVLDARRAGRGDTTLEGGAGDDRLMAAAGEARLDGGPGRDTLTGGASLDTLLGGPGDDRLLGGAQDDRLAGGDGADRLTGGGGQDLLRGGRGADVLHARDGGSQDRLLCEDGAGRDRGVVDGADFTGGCVRAQRAGAPRTLLDVSSEDAPNLEDLEVAAGEPFAIGLMCPADAGRCSGRAEVRAGARVIAYGRYALRGGTRRNVRIGCRDVCARLRRADEVLRPLVLRDRAGGVRRTVTTPHLVNVQRSE
jgi:Ca2+-binding RTX toxin-like protein